MNYEEYNEELARFRTQAAYFREITMQYRSRMIGDEAFLAARKYFDLAQSAMDKAETSHIEWVDNERESA